MIVSAKKCTSLADGCQQFVAVRRRCSLCRKLSSSLHLSFRVDVRTDIVWADRNGLLFAVVDRSFDGKRQRHVPSLLWPPSVSLGYVEDYARRLVYVLPLWHQRSFSGFLAISYSPYTEVGECGSRSSVSRNLRPSQYSKGRLHFHTFRRRQHCRSLPLFRERYSTVEDTK